MDQLLLWASAVVSCSQTTFSILVCLFPPPQIKAEKAAWLRETTSADQSVEFSSLPMHALAEEISDDGIFELSSTLALGRDCLQIVFKQKYFSNAIHAILRMLLII